jgi:hypothetical protein
VASRISAPAIGEVGRESWLGLHNFMGNSIEASRGGVAHWETCVRRRWRGGVLTGVRLERRWRRGGRPVRVVAGVCAVLGEAPVGVGNGQSDLSTWMASETLSATVCTQRVNGVRAGGRRRRDHNSSDAWLT